MYLLFYFFYVFQVERRQPVCLVLLLKFDIFHLAPVPVLPLTQYWLYLQRLIIFGRVFLIIRSGFRFEIVALETVLQHRWPEVRSLRHRLIYAKLIVEILRVRAFILVRVVELTQLLHFFVVGRCVYCVVIIKRVFDSCRCEVPLDPIVELVELNLLPSI